jgi:two-component system cell cycle sensor histidine kinase/response regulator CckA
MVVGQGRRGRVARDEIALLRWLGRSSQSAVALVRAGHVALTNALFRDLERPSGEWRWSFGQHAQLRYPSLRQLAAAEARDLFRGRDGSRECRFVRSGQAIELRFERIGTATGPVVIVLAHDVAKEVRRDAERLRDRETQLHQERMHAMGVVASGLAHDLNHSLNVIALRIATLRADPRFKPAQRRLDSLVRVVDPAASTVARLQDLAHRRRDRPGDSVDLSAVLLGAIEMARPEIEGTGIDVRIDDHVPPLPLVRGTAAELSHLFADLLTNARDASPAGGSIEVRAWADRGEVIVTIADQGAGIPEESLSRVFDPFFSASDKRDTGLILSIAYGLMHRLGGRISASNRATGGAVFTLAFPCAAPAQRQKARAGGERRPVRVLLVDDEVDNLEVLQELLEMEGHRVDAAPSGPAALERFHRGERYDVVLCDVGMPQMSGWQVVREIRRIAPDVRIWLLTGWANEISEHDPRLADVQGVLGKPLDLEQLRLLLSHPGEPSSNHRAMGRGTFVQGTAGHD